MEDTRMFDHKWKLWTCDVCNTNEFINSCGCMEYSELDQNRRLQDLELQKLGYLVYTNPEILELLKDQVNVGHAVWTLDRRMRLLDEAYAKWKPFEDQYYDGYDDGF